MSAKSNSFKLGCAALLAAACSDAYLQPKAAIENTLDDRLALTGDVCTSVPDPTGFPVKVVLIVDQSGSMCISDPPGSQGPTGFCEMYGLRNGVPGRVGALNRLLDQFQTQPNVLVSLVPFETNIKNPWPPTVGAGAKRFARPDSTLRTAVNRLASELGKGTDYQGALSYAYQLISGDIDDTERSNPQVLPRTRYVVVFLTDGTPFPRCSANDNLPQYAGPTNPELAWEDSVGAGDFCNTIDPTDPDAITGFVKGTDRNQNYQLFSYVDQLMELRSSHNIGDIRLHTVLLFNKAAVTACGMICEDIYGQYPGVAPANYTDAAHTIAQWTLTRMAERGNGVFQEFNNGDIQTMGLGALDYSSLASKNVMKTLMLKALSSAPGATDRVVDADGDGLDDTLDNSFKSKSNQFFIDSDGDCFDDAFEVMHKDDGFRPDQKDTRGCDPASPITLGCTCRDTDGDGLSQYAELYLKTSAGLPDSDGDGIPDGLEARYGLDPLIPQKPGTDTDGDGVPDVVEFKLDSNPTRRDVEFQEKDGYRYEATPTEMPDGRMCYHFRVSNARLVTPPNQSGQRQGYNLFKLYFAEAPESAVAADYGVWKTACAWAEYAPPSVRVPAQPELQLVPTDFVTPSQMNDSAAYRSRCKGTPP